MRVEGILFSLWRGESLLRKRGEREQSFENSREWEKRGWLLQHRKMTGPYYWGPIWRGNNESNCPVMFFFLTVLAALVYIHRKCTVKWTNKLRKEQTSRSQGNLTKLRNGSKDEGQSPLLLWYRLCSSIWPTSSTHSPLLTFSRAGGWSRPRGSLPMSVFHTFRSHSRLFSSGVSPAWSFGLFNDLFGLTADRRKHKVSKEVRESSHTKRGS